DAADGHRYYGAYWPERSQLVRSARGGCDTTAGQVRLRPWAYSRRVDRLPPGRGALPHGPRASLQYRSRPAGIASVDLGVLAWLLDASFGEYVVSVALRQQC